MSASDNSNVTLFRWEVVDFWKQRFDAGDKGLTSQSFSISSRPSIQFEMFIRYGNGMKQENDVRVILKRLDDKPLEASMKIWVESVGGQKFGETFIEKHVFSKIDDFCGYKGLIGDEKDNFWKLTSNHETFLFCCEITDLNALKIPSFNCDQAFHQKHWALYENEEFCDAIFKVGGQEFKVSKVFLASQSQVFKNMFASNFREGRTSTIEIMDVDENTAKHLIKWLYTSKLEVGAPIEKVFYVADKYDIELLKSTCVHLMLNSFDTVNSFSCLIIAVQHNDHVLKEAALNYIANLPTVDFIKFSKSPEWIELNNKNAKIAQEVGNLLEEKMKK